jgi:hypothetical protein
MQVDGSDPYEKRQELRKMRRGHVVCLSTQREQRCDGEAWAERAAHTGGQGCPRSDLIQRFDFSAKEN